MNDELVLCQDALDESEMISKRFVGFASLMECMYPTYKVVRRSCCVNSLKIHVLHEQKIIFVIGRP